MRTKTIVLIVAAAGLSALLATSSPAAVRYVNLNNPAPAPPYGTWATAATNIQDAIDEGDAGDEVVVTNGVYQTGGRAVDGTSTNRVTVDRPLTLRSVNGPEATVIDGASAVRCVYLTNGAALLGFKLTNGIAEVGGGVWCESASGLVSNCVLIGNSSSYLGGGAYGGTLNNCTLTGNSANRGGGAFYATLNNCALTGNSAYVSGGGRGGDGGGASGCTLNNCTLTRNSSTGGNFGGGGAVNCTLNNCIAYYNTAGLTVDNYRQSTLNYSCTTPLPDTGTGNIAIEPQLTDLSHLSANSPCRAAGSAAHTSGMDIDGEAWANPPPMGCDEFHSDATTGPLSVAIAVDNTFVVPGFTANLTAILVGRARANRWEFGDGTIVSNQPVSVSHIWSAAGDYTVAFRAYNDNNPGGVSAMVTVQVATQTVYYVAVDNASPVSPYNSWETAATNIQDAVDAAPVGALVLVTNGVYQTGRESESRVVVTKPLILRSVNGPEVTVIDGINLVRCVYLTSGTTLTGFTLTNGAHYFGAGVWCESAGAVVSNCVLSGNSASGFGGGVYQGTLNDCTLTGNSATWGGGASDGTLNNCTLNGNRAQSGGGVYQGTLNNCTMTGNSATSVGGGAYGYRLNNCIVYFNTAPIGANYFTDQFVGRILNYCCTTPLPTNGQGNFTNAPLFVDQAGGNLRLQSNSACINAGLNAYAPAGIDLDGHLRVSGGTVDVGAYEFQSPQSVISYAWLQGYGLPTDGSADFTDPDGDRLTNWQEWRCGTDPTNALSVLRLLAPASGAPGVTVRWQSVTDRTYFLERSTNLGTPPAFGMLASNLVGQAGTTFYTDTNAVGIGPFFYRVGVQE